MTHEHCTVCGFRIKRIGALEGRPMQYVHCWPRPAAPEGIVADTPEWRVFTEEYGKELGMYVLRTQDHDARP